MKLNNDSKYTKKKFRGGINVMVKKNEIKKTATELTAAAL